MKETEEQTGSSQSTGSPTHNSLPPSLLSVSLYKKRELNKVNLKENKKKNKLFTTGISSGLIETWREWQKEGKK